MRPIRTLLIPVVLLAVLPLAAQGASETITVQVVEVEAVVIDGTGAPVEGLRSEDLEVRVNGKPAEITNFYRIHRGVAQDVPQDEVRARGFPRHSRSRRA